MTDGGAYDIATKVACPYANCGAGRGMKCLVHHNDGSAPSIRDSPHVSRVRKAQDAGYGQETPDHIVEFLNDPVGSTRNG